MKKFIKKYFKGISWQNQYFSVIFYIIDIADGIVRKINGLGELPKYSIRIRSVGIESQFGGKVFAELGAVTADLLKDHARLEPESKILEIGCGRTAFALSKVLNDGNYIGMDINKKSLESCNTNPLFKKKNYKFDLIDIINPLYNPNGQLDAKNYKFPYPDESVDIIFMISVYTHMLPEEIQAYNREISRLLKPNGRCLFSTFIMDYGHTGGIDFPYDHGFYRLHQEKNPEKAVGYNQKFLVDDFASVGMKLFKEPMLGIWHKEEIDTPRVDFGQDVVVFAKNGKLSIDK